MTSPECLKFRPIDAPAGGGCSTGCSNPPDLTSDLARLVEKWPTLPEHIKAAVMALVTTASVNPPTDPKGLDDALPPGFERATGEAG